MIHRISDAASRLWTTRDSTSCRMTVPQYVQCVDNARGGAIATIDRPRLPALAASAGSIPQPERLADLAASKVV